LERLRPGPFAARGTLWRRAVRAMRRPASALPHPAGRAAGRVAVRCGFPGTASRPALACAAALMARPEAVGTSARLADGELGNRTRRRLLPILPRQRGADQRPMHRPFVGAVPVHVALFVLDVVAKSSSLFAGWPFEEAE
jgi:hypothetical protein